MILTPCPCSPPPVQVNRPLFFAFLILPPLFTAASSSPLFFKPPPRCTGLAVWLSSVLVFASVLRFLCSASPRALSWVNFCACAEHGVLEVQIAESCWGKIGSSSCTTPFIRDRTLELFWSLIAAIHVHADTQVFILWGLTLAMEEGFARLQVRNDQ